MEGGGPTQSAHFVNPDENGDETGKLSVPRYGTESELDFNRLKRVILSGNRWQFSFIDCPREIDRCTWIKRINSELNQNKSELRIGELNLSAQIPDVQALLCNMEELSKDYDVVHVLNGTDWFSSSGRWEFFNVNRDNFARRCPASWLFWGGSPLIVSCVDGARDLWTWRAGVYRLAADDLGDSFSPVRSD